MRKLQAVVHTEAAAIAASGQARPASHTAHTAVSTIATHCLQRRLPRRNMGFSSPRFKVSAVCRMSTPQLPGCSCSACRPCHPAPAVGVTLQRRVAGFQKQLQPKRGDQMASSLSRVSSKHPAPSVDRVPAPALATGCKSVLDACRKAWAGGTMGCLARPAPPAGHTLAACLSMRSRCSCLRCANSCVGNQTALHWVSLGCTTSRRNLCTLSWRGHTSPSPRSAACCW